VGQTTHDGEYSGNESSLSRVNKTDNGSYKDDALDDAYRDDMPAISGHWATCWQPFRCYELLLLLCILHRDVRTKRD